MLQVTIGSTFALSLTDIIDMLQIYGVESA